MVQELAGLHTLENHSGIWIAGFLSSSTRYPWKERGRLARNTKEADLPGFGRQFLAASGQNMAIRSGKKTERNESVFQKD